MAMSEEEMVRRIRGLHPDAVLELAGEDCSFELYIVSEAFAGMSAIRRQQPILALFADELASGALHALSVKAKTPAEQAAGGAVGLVQLSP